MTLVIVDDLLLDEDETDRAVVVEVMGTVMRFDGSGSLKRILKHEVKGLVSQTFQASYSCSTGAKSHPEQARDETRDDSRSGS